MGLFSRQPKSAVLPPSPTDEAREILVQAKEEALRIRGQAQEEARQAQQKSQQLEEKLKKIEQVEQEQAQKLSEIASISKEKAKKEYFKKLEKELADEAARKIKDAENFAREEAEKKAREILASVLQRIAVEHVAASTVTQVHLPSDEMKGPIIGKEGRNIRALEAATGVQVEIGEEPGVVTLSAFDPVRREVARLALEKLLADGRIQPARIEEVVEKTRGEVEKIIREAGQEHALKAGVSDLPTELIPLLGRFKFRTSYGQSMLEHNLEVVQIGVLLAKELGANVEVVRKACLLHDLGKAVSGEVEGGHAEVGAEIARRYGVAEEVVQAFEHHHSDDLPTPEAIVVYLADAISAARPGARREDYEAYIQRMEELENIAAGFHGVENAYAIAAGREVRVVVRPQDVSDSAMVKLAHDISKKIHEQVQNFPGEIKVTVIRETRAVGFAKGKN